MKTTSRRLAVALSATIAGAVLSVASALTPDSDPLLVTREHRQATGLIVHLMTNYHYLKAPLDDGLSRQVLQRYLDSLDPNRLIFLQSDIAGFEVYRERLDDYLRTSYLKPGFDIFKVFRTRVAERAEFANQLLEQSFDFTVEEAYEFRDENASWPLSLDEMKDLWRKRVKNDLLSLLLTGRTEEEAMETLRQRYSGIERRANQLNADDVYQLFINAYTTAVEPHTSYFSPRTSENFNIRMSLSLEGIGAALQTENEYTIVRRIIPGGPADMSKNLHVDDLIIGVGQGSEEPIVDVISWRLEDVVDLIRGPKDTVVRLEVLRKDSGSKGPSEVITLVRNKIKLEEQAAKKSTLDLPEGSPSHRIGVINLPTFYLDMAAMARGDRNYRSTTRDVRELIQALEGEGMDGLIIDLRGNGGGSLVEATELTGLFIRSGPVVQVKDSSGSIKINDDPDPGIAYDGPLLVLVDRQSASASEIFAGAIQDYRRGIVVGEPTYGKGTVQNVVDLNRFVGADVGNLGQLKVTIAQFFRVNGDSTQHRGVVPDIVLPTAFEGEDQGERALKNALPWATVRAALYKPRPELGLLVEAVRARHNSRMLADPGFQYLLAEAHARDAVEKITAVSLVEERRKQEIETRKQARETRLNQFRQARGLAPVAADAVEDEESEEEFDVVLDEAALILGDLIEFSAGPEVLRANLEGAPSALDTIPNVH